MTRLTSLDLSINNLNIISQGALSGLRLDYLFMDNNPTLRLQDTSFVGMTTEVLSLKKCDITDPRPAIFRPLLGALRKLILNENKIERFSPNMLDIFQDIEGARIFDNPLICDCESKWLKEFYDLNKDSSKIRDPGNPSHDPRCAGPRENAGRFFSRLAVSDFACDKPTLHAGITFNDNKGVLSCTSRGNPLPAVYWYRPNGIVVKSEPQGNLPANTNELELFPNEPSVQGLYKCVASNDGGNISLTVNVDWPFQSDSANEGGATKCNPNNGKTTPREVEITTSNDAVTEAQTDVFKVKYFTLVDIVGAILGTFVCTLIVTILTLHFCVYRRRKPSQYATPPMSDYSSSNGSDKNGPYPLSLHSLHTSHMPSQRPLPNKPYTHKMYDENHYMATNVEERDEFLRLHGNGRVTPASSCDTTCQACRTMNHSNIS